MKRRQSSAPLPLAGGGVGVQDSARAPTLTPRRQSARLGRHLRRTGPDVLVRRPQLPRPSRRHAGVGPAGERGAPGRAIVQVSPASRHPHGRTRGAERAGRAAGRRPARTQHTRHHRRALRWPGRRQPEPLAVAALRPAGDQLRPRADPVRGLLLQDIHVAGFVLGEGVRATDPSCGRARARCQL